MLRYIILLICGIFPLFGFGQLLEPVQWSVTALEQSDGAVVVRATAKIEKGWYIYDLKAVEDGPVATSLTFSLPDGVETKGLPTITTAIKSGFDSIFEAEIGKGYDSVVVEQILATTFSGNFKVEGQIEWQACNNKSCIAPQTHQFTFELESSKQTMGNKMGLENISLSKILEAILWGIAALLTPCVFPMVPMTISYFLKRSDNPAKGRRDALIFGASIVTLYTLPVAIVIASTYLLGGEGVTANIFNFLATHYIPNIIFFLVFVTFAASFFGAFEISLPSKLVNSSDKRVDKGGLAAIFFMALTLVLVSFSCTGPIVGSVLVNSTQGGILEPIITMGAFSCAFALPFTLLALFPSLLKKLPKSGEWLSSVKVVLGFIELALSLKFLSIADQTYHWGLLNREVYLALWIVIFSLLGFYFLGKLRFAHQQKVENISFTRLILAIATLSFVVYLIPGLFGAPLKALSGYLPPLTSQEFVLGQNSGVSGVNRVSSDNNTDLYNRAAAQNEQNSAKYSDFLHLPHNLSGYFTLEEGIVASQATNKPILLIFTGHGCVNCREMEAVVWSETSVLELLRDKYILVALYTDDKTTLPEADWVTTPSGRVIKRLGGINAQLQIDKFGVNAQPYYVILNKNGKILGKPVGYNLNIITFVNFLEDGISLFDKSNDNLHK